jgi:4-hydroxy-tetrahydrodipicolinate synthase
MASQLRDKEWAQDHLQGIENQTMPSFTPGLDELDEEAIRWDVQHAIDQGFSSTLCTCEAGLEFEEAKRFVEIVVEEAGEDIHVSTTLLFDSLDQNREMLAHGEEIGLDTALLGYPLDWHPDSPGEVIEVSRDMIESTDVGVLLYPTPKFSFERFHPSGFPLSLLDELADLPNVIGAKIGKPDLMADVYNRVGDRLVISNPYETDAPANVMGFDMQFMGAGPYDVYQTPEKPRLVEYFDLLLEGEYDEALALYWELKPIRETFFQQMAPQFRVGTYHFPEHKYYQWLTGGNGGYTRQPAMALSDQDKRSIRGAMQGAGLDLREDDAEFYAGRVNYDGDGEASADAGDDGAVEAEQPAGDA